MKTKITFLISTIVSFFIGVLVTYLVITKQQMDAILQAKSMQVSHQSSTNHSLSNDSIGYGSQSRNTASLAETNQSQDIKGITEIINKEDIEPLSINDYSETQVKQIVDNMPDVVVGQYVNKFMAKDASEVITDKRRFAERAIEELYRPNDSQQLVGIVRMSFEKKPPVQSQDTSNVSKFAKIYAHLDTRMDNSRQAPASQFVFVKWVNNQTGQVLLFEKKDILINSEQNWVSFVPDGGWQVGSYDVKFYQFTSELEPIAQTTYMIYQVVE